MQGSKPLLDFPHSGHISNGQFIPMFPRWNLKASSEANVFSSNTTKLKKEMPGYQRSLALATPCIEANFLENLGTKRIQIPNRELVG